MWAKQPLLSGLRHVLWVWKPNVSLEFMSKLKYILICESVWVFQKLDDMLEEGQNIYRLPVAS
jgi:hypothetical protein